MSVRNLRHVTNPSSVALIGASAKPSTVGEVITRNLLNSGFSGPVYLVNPNYRSIGTTPSYPDVESLPEAPDLAVVATPREAVPELVGKLGKLGTRAAVVVTDRFGEGGDEEGRRLCDKMLEAARPYNLRIIGPNCLGIMVPGTSLNASMGHIVRPTSGTIAFVAQSGTVQTSVLDWAASRGIGFSCFISLGDMADVDFGDMLDYLASDFRSRSILLYMETVTHCRKFMSAARVASRVKPVIVVKAGRSKEGALAAARHTGAVPGDDAVYDAAFRRAGMLRVVEMQSLFDAIETLAMMARPISGDRLAILTNGGGVGVMAADAVIEREGRLAEFAPETMSRLDAVLPSSWSRGNPVDIMSDASAERYADGLEVLLEDDHVDAVLVLSCPVAIVSGKDTALAVTKAYENHQGRPNAPILLASWLGEETASEARRVFAEHRIPSYGTPTDAVRAFMHMVRYRKSQQMLMETPPSIPELFSPHVEKVLRIVEDALGEGREWLSAAEALSVLEAYSIPTGACRRGPSFGGPVRDGNGRVLETTPGIRSHAPHPLMVKVVIDAQFGPVILFGHGGEFTREINDTAVTFPPLNLHLAREVMSRTRVHNLLKGNQEMPASDLDGIALCLVKVSQLVCDIAEIAEMEINPLLAGPGGILARKATIRVSPSTMAASERLAIRPYPKELEDVVTARDGRRFQIRPIMPEDEARFLDLVESLTPEERRMRFLHPIQVLPHHEVVRLTQIDYDREMALVLASCEGSGVGGQVLYGCVRLITHPGNESAEYAILVRRNMAGKGLGKLLMRRIIDYGRSWSIREITGQVLRENIPMLKVCASLGFTTKQDPDEPGVVVVSLKL